jgi:anti-anti-sigma factor
VPLEISVKETKPGAFLVILTGELDTNTYGKLEQELDPILVRAAVIIFELKELTYISSMGLRTLAKIRKTMEEKGGSVMLVNPQPQVKHVFEAVQFLSDSLLSSLEEADELLDSYLNKIQKGEIAPRKPQA